MTKKSTDHKLAYSGKDISCKECIRLKKEHVEDNDEFEIFCSECFRKEFEDELMELYKKPNTI